MICSSRTHLIPRGDAPDGEVRESVSLGGGAPVEHVVASPVCAVGKRPAGRWILVISVA